MATSQEPAPAKRICIIGRGSAFKKVDWTLTDDRNNRTRKLGAFFGCWKEVSHIKLGGSAVSLA
jgi:hypothetical protein